MSKLVCRGKTEGINAPTPLLLIRYGRRRPRIPSRASAEEYWATFAGGLCVSTSLHSRAAYTAAMGIMRRAMKRAGELPETHGVLLKWRRDGDALAVEFLDPMNGGPLTRERHMQPQTLLDMVARTVNPPRFSPAYVTFRRAVEAGRGELRVELRSEQFARLR